MSTNLKLFILWLFIPIILTVASIIKSDPKLIAVGFIYYIFLTASYFYAQERDSKKER